VKQLVLAAVVAIALTTASQAHAQLAGGVTLEAQTAAAARIVVGTVSSTNVVSVTNAAGDTYIATEVVVAVSRTIKGTATSTLTLTIPGGTLSGVTMRAPHERIPLVGERLRVFAIADGPRWKVLNGRQGLMRSVD
jgi:hypothetical protein